MNDDVQKNGIARVVADMELEIDKAAKAIHEADFILIAAGAGVSSCSAVSHAISNPIIYCRVQRRFWLASICRYCSS